MLTIKMSLYETVRELMDDARWIEGWITQNSKIFSKELLRQRHEAERKKARAGFLSAATAVKEVTAPRTQNVWTVMWIIPEGEAYPKHAAYTTQQDENGIYVYQTVLSEEGGMELLIFMPHFFRRYRERAGIENLKPRQLIRQYVKRNLYGTFERNGYHKGYPSYLICTKEGVSLGYYLSQQIFLCNTFITYDMAYPGKQQKIIDHGKEKQEKQRYIYNSAGLRDIIRYTRNIEQIAEQSEKEWLEQKQKQHDDTPKTENP